MLSTLLLFQIFGNSVGADWTHNPITRSERRHVPTHPACSAEIFLSINNPYKYFHNVSWEMI